MFIGEFTHTIDDKKRLTLPSKFKKDLGKKVIVTHGLDNCLFMFTLSEWKKIAEKLASLSMGNSDSRGFNRIMLAGAVEADVDASGRILMPDFLCEYMNVDKIKNKIVFAGLHNRIELWEENKWKNYKISILKEADNLAEKLGNIGAI